MLAFGLNKKLCSDFLKKQATIGNLDEGKGWDLGEEGGDTPLASLGRSGTTPAPLSFSSPEQYKLLSDHIEQMATE